jgi:hypothetical protein
LFSQTCLCFKAWGSLCAKWFWKSGNRYGLSFMRC